MLFFFFYATLDEQPILFSYLSEKEKKKHLVLLN